MYPPCTPHPAQPTAVGEAVVGNVVSRCFQQLMRFAYVDATAFCFLWLLTVKTKLTQGICLRPLTPRIPSLAPGCSRPAAPQDACPGCGARPCQSHRVCRR